MRHVKPEPVAGSSGSSGVAIAGATSPPSRPPAMARWRCPSGTTAREHAARGCLRSCCCSAVMRRTPQSWMCQGWWEPNTGAQPLRPAMSCGLRASGQAAARPPAQRRAAPTAAQAVPILLARRLRWGCQVRGLEREFLMTPAKGNSWPRNRCKYTSEKQQSLGFLKHSVTASEDNALFKSSSKERK